MVGTKADLLAHPSELALEIVRYTRIGITADSFTHALSHCQLDSSSGSLTVPRLGGGGGKLLFEIG